MCVDLEPAAHRSRDQGSERFWILHQETGVPGVVAVVGEKRRAPAAERTVRVELDRANGEVVFVVFQRPRLAEMVERLALPADHHVVADRKLPFVDGLLVEPDRAEVYTGVVDSGEPVASGLGESEVEGLPLLGFAR